MSLDNACAGTKVGASAVFGLLVVAVVCDRASSWRVVCGSFS